VLKFESERRSQAPVAQTPPETPGQGGPWEALSSPKTWALGAIVAIVLAVAFFQSPTHLGFDRVRAQWAFDAGVAHDKDGKLDLAIERYDRAIALDPELAEAYNNRGSDRRRQGDLDGAIADYGEVIRLRPDSEAGYYNRGITWQMKGDADAALSDFASAIPPARAELQRRERDRSGNFIRGLHNTLQAKVVLRDIYNAQARSLVDTGKYEHAIASIDAAIAAGERSWPSDEHFERARVRLLQGEFAEAAAEFDRFIASEDNGYKSGALMYRGLIALFHANDPKAALQDLENSVREGLVQRDALRRILDGAGPRLSSGVLMRPNGYYLIIWQFFARERDGQWGRLVLEENSKHLAKALGYGDLLTAALSPADMARALAAWPGPIIEMLLRMKTPEALRAAAEAADANLRSRRTCEVDFYTGLFRLKSAPAEARVLLQRAGDNCPPGTLAGLAARLEVGRFGS
jgi:tetratricopeptide (TPR) repeat protein